MTELEPDLQALEIPEGVSRAAFRGTLVAYAEEFNRLGHVPTLKEVYDLWPRVPQKTMAIIIQSPEFEVGCQLLGVPVDRLGGLSQEQILALSVLATPDGKSIPVKLRSLGIPFGRYRNWRKQPLFRQRYEEMTAGAYYDQLGEIRQTLVNKAVDGNMDAIKLVFAKTGEYDPAKQATQDALLIVTKMAELVMKNVRSADEREAIMLGMREFGVEAQAARVHSLEAGNMQP